MSSKYNVVKSPSHRRQMACINVEKRLMLMTADANPKTCESTLELFSPHQ